MCGVHHLRQVRSCVIHRHSGDSFLNILAVLAVFLVDNGGQLICNILREFPQIGNTLSVGLRNIEQVFCSVIFTENGNTALTAIDKSTEFIPSINRCYLCGIGVLVIDQSRVRKALLVHSRRKTEEVCQQLLVAEQLVRNFRPIFADGFYS
ncbi:MAG: hypothetical protein K2J80_10045 [Oscillospiraceae bacterium]|nr:hypothetical protein [Oscillospiraceae bacterium]